MSYQARMRTPLLIVTGRTGAWGNTQRTPGSPSSAAIDALATAYSGRAKVGKLNVDENPAVAQTYGVRSIPTLLVLKGGQVVDQQIGALPQPRIAAMLDKQLEEPLVPSVAGAGTTRTA